MNVEELLALSEQYITLSRENSLHDMYGAASANAAIAQAAAATAQAMVLAQMTENQPAASRRASAQAECHPLRKVILSWGEVAGSRSLQ